MGETVGSKCVRGAFQIHHPFFLRRYKKSKLEKQRDQGNVG